jgi:hypothetical protein
MNAFGLTFSLNSFIDFRNFLSFHFYSFQPNGPLIKILINSRASRGDITIGYGDLLRNSDKQWLSGFSRNLASVISAYNSDQNLKCFFLINMIRESTYLVELRDISVGLCLSCYISATKVKVHVDSSQARS